MKNNKETLFSFSEVMFGLAEDFGGKISDPGIKARFLALKEYSIDQITQAGTWLLKNRTEKFPPVPTTKEIIDAISIVTVGTDLKTRAELEADKVFKKLREWGKEAKPLFLDENTAYLMTHRWSFEQLGNMTAEDLKWFRKDFVTAYQEIEKVDESNLIEFKGNGRIPAEKLKMLANSVGRIEK